jgi:hypothetical protein
MKEEFDLGFVYAPENGKGLKVTINKFRDQWYVHLREYVEDPDEDIWFPTKKGIAIKSEYVDVVAEMFADAGQILANVYRSNIYNLILEDKQLELFKEGEE